MLLSDHRALRADGSERAAGRLWSALHTAAPVKIFELLPYAVPPGVGLSHPFSRTLPARYGAAGILPEALSLRKRLLRDVEAANPAVVCLLDHSLLPLAFVLRSRHPDIKLCLLASGAEEGQAADVRFPAFEGIFAYCAGSDLQQDSEAILSLLNAGTADRGMCLTGLERLDEHAIFNPLTRFFGARFLYWGHVDNNDLEATLSTSSGVRFDNTSFELMARGAGWTLFQFMAILNKETEPEDAALTVRQLGQGENTVI